MSPELTRIVVVVAVVGIAVALGVIVKRVQPPEHPEVTVGEVGDRPGVVLFTSTDCGKCKDAIALLESESIPFREVTHDLEPQRFGTWDVVAVPLTVVIDEQGDAIRTLSGVPKRKQLLQAVRQAGIVS